MEIEQIIEYLARIVLVLLFFVLVGGLDSILTAIGL